MGALSATERDIARAFEAELSAEPLPFGEGFDAARQDVLNTGRTDSFSHLVKERATTALRALSDHTGEQFDIPEGTWSNRTAKAMLATLDARSGVIAERRGGGDFGPADGRLVTGAEIQKEATAKVAADRERAAKAGGVAAFLGGSAGQLADPFNLATLPLGLFAAEGWMAKAGIEFAIGAGVQTGIEAASLPAKDFAGVTPTAGETAGNILLTGVAGAGLATIFHGAGQLARRAGMLADYRAKVKAGVIEPTRQGEAAAEALQDAIDATPPLASPAAEAAHFEATTAAVDVHTAEHPVSQAAALRRLDEKVRAYVEHSLPPELVKPTGRLSDLARGPTATRAAENWREMPAAQYVAEMTADLTREETAARTAATSKVVAREKHRQTLLAEIRRGGGMSYPTNFVKKGQLGQSGLLTAVRKGGVGIDQWHATMVEEGKIPAETDINDFFEMLTGGVKNMAAQDKAGNAAADAIDTGMEHAWIHVRRLEEARAELKGAHPDNPEPTAGQVEDYARDPAEYIRRLERGDIDAAVAAEESAPVGHDLEAPIPPRGSVEPAPAAADDVATASFDAATEANPDLSASYNGPDGTPVAGNARQLMAAAREEESFARGLLDCVLAGGPAE